MGRRFGKFESSPCYDSILLFQIHTRLNFIPTIIRRALFPGTQKIQVLSSSEFPVDNLVSKLAEFHAAHLQGGIHKMLVVYVRVIASIQSLALPVLFLLLPILPMCVQMPEPQTTAKHFVVELKSLNRPRVCEQCIPVPVTLRCSV